MAYAPYTFWESGNATTFEFSQENDLVRCWNLRFWIGIHLSHYNPYQSHIYKLPQDREDSWNGYHTLSVRNGSNSLAQVYVGRYAIPDIATFSRA